jgi:hypothetical protein
MNRTLLLAIVLTAATALAACGGEKQAAAPPGSPQNPLVGKKQQAPTKGRSNEGAAQTRQDGADRQPGYQKLVDRQTSKPRSHFTPCNLVSKSQARAILGTTIQDPLEAPQGPTCIYRSRDGRSFVTLAVQQVRFEKVKGQIRGRQAVSVADKTGYCGKYGQPVLYLPLSRSQVLTVTAPCQVARQFAQTAVGRLRG